MDIIPYYHIFTLAIKMSAHYSIPVPPFSFYLNLFCFINKRWGKSKGQLRMDNLETLATPFIQDSGRRHKNVRHIYKDEQHGLHQTKPEVNRGDRER